ncbi:hypothetical protein [Methylobacterium sp. 275MFSha3.1]|uniref:hypothetical protein n=1 Tax=Methylobacterium sp. 275MFSha3.1 TaxID=1502746 RepID=UPI00147DC7FB|nr:hypothetical protein [Methylobacterium sp. 275MFSha3.1]
MIDHTDELLGGFSDGGILRHCDCGLLQRAKLLKPRDWITSPGDRRLYEALDQFACQALIKTRCDWV